jgi:hypothetical protein
MEPPALNQPVNFQMHARIDDIEEMPVGVFEG